MSKTKKHKKKKKSISILKEVDKTMEKTYDTLIEEIQDMQLKLNLSDQKAMKKQKKKLRQEMGVIPYYTSKDRVNARLEIIKQMEQTSLLDRVELTLKNLVPVVICIARLIAALILSILSVEPIRKFINPNMLGKMDKVYKVAMSIK